MSLGNAHSSSHLAPNTVACSDSLYNPFFPILMPYTYAGTADIMALHMSSFLASLTVFYTLLCTGQGTLVGNQYCASATPVYTRLDASGVER